MAFVESECVRRGVESAAGEAARGRGGGKLHSPWSSVLILAFLSGYWMLLTINSAPGEFSVADFWVILVLCAGGVAAQVSCYVALYFALRRMRRGGVGYRVLRGVWRWWPAAAAVVNFLSLHAVFLWALVKWSGWQVAGLGVFALPVAFLLFGFVNALGKKGRCACVGVAGVLFAVQAGFYVQYVLTGALPAAPAGQTSAEEVRMVELKRRPNIYLISFDALAPEAVTRRADNLNIDVLPYQRWMIEAGFRRFRSAFSDGGTTLSSLNRLLAMHPDYYARVSAREDLLFQGMAPAPLFEIFAANGYRTHTYYGNDYMGNKKGPHVDGYHVYYPFSICLNHPPPLAQEYGFFGYCSRFIFHNRFLAWLGRGDLMDIRTPAPQAVFEFVTEDIREKLEAGGAHVFMVHFAWPNHVGHDYDRYVPERYEDYRRRFLDVSTYVVPGLMQGMFDLIRARDPDAIVLYYSDHGTWAGKGRRRRLLPEKAPLEAHRSAVLDGYGILMGVYPADVCAEYIDAEPRLARVATPSMVVRLLLRCLSEGEDPVPGLAFEDYAFYSEFRDAARWTFPADVAPVSYEAFLYE